MTNRSRLPHLSRRQALTLFAGSVGALGARQVFAQADASRVATILPSNVCLLTPQAVEGPYYFDPKLVRADITEGLPGIPTKLMLQVIEAASCTPVENARVDVWHCSAVGHYSGYAGQGDDRQTSTEGKTFLRGTQMTDGSGLVSFATIYPGWYRGRTTHIHFKVFLDERSVLVGQIYFPDALNEFIYRNVAPYTERAADRDTTNGADGVLAASGGGHDSFCSIKEETDHYLASLVVGVDRSAEAVAGAAPAGPGGPPPGAPPSSGPPASAGPRDGASLVPGGG
jgi:protocatechuate 3,4-dioxygenase beta subunit